MKEIEKLFIHIKDASPEGIVVKRLLELMKHHPEVTLLFLEQLMDAGRVEWVGTPKDDDLIVNLTVRVNEDHGLG